MTHYIAVIGDLIHSRALPDRGQTQAELKHLFETLNQSFSTHIVSNFTLTLGDEFQAILEPTGPLWTILDRLRIDSPVLIRLGIGYGEIRTAIDPMLSIGADGEAFWRARDAIAHVHTQNWNGKCHVRFQGPDATQDALINTILLAAETLKDGWTDLQAETFAALQAMGITTADFVQNDVADALGITASSLSKRLTAGNIKIYLHLRETLAHLLEAYHAQ